MASRKYKAWLPPGSVRWTLLVLGGVYAAFRAIMPRFDSYELRWTPELLDLPLLAVVVVPTSVLLLAILRRRPENSGVAVGQVIGHGPLTVLAIAGAVENAHFVYRGHAWSIGMAAAAASMLKWLSNSVLLGSGLAF